MSERVDEDMLVQALKAAKHWNRSVTLRPSTVEGILAELRERRQDDAQAIAVFGHEGGGVRRVYLTMRQVDALETWRAEIARKPRPTAAEVSAALVVDDFTKARQR